MTAMISAMIAMVRVFMRTFPSRVWAHPGDARRRLNYPAMPDMTAKPGVTFALSGFVQRGVAPLPPGLRRRAHRGRGLSRFAQRDS